MAEAQTAPPVLSTPDNHILAESIEVNANLAQERLSDEELEVRYEISRTITEIRQNKWRRVALQFPDEMLTHSARVYQRLARGLEADQPRAKEAIRSSLPDAVATSEEAAPAGQNPIPDEAQTPVKLMILGDTSYGSCCVDEIAAEHIDADAVVHYGRACLSPTARLPVVHIYTQRDIDYDDAMGFFRNAFPSPDAKVVVTADMPYARHIEPLTQQLRSLGYTSVFDAPIIHNPSSLIPNRTLPPSIASDPSTLSDWSLFHISTPPTSLLLTLQSRLEQVVIYPTSENARGTANSTQQTTLLLRRRYALLTSLATTQVWGILINTLSISNYMSIISHIQSLLASRGRKSYIFVVGKINPAKLANFSEIGGWVVVGCWESSLIDSKEFYRPIITPFELEMALKKDEERVWGDGWRGDFESVLNKAETTNGNDDLSQQVTSIEISDEEDDSEDEPPEFDLRTGKYVSTPKPPPKQKLVPQITNGTAATALIKRSNGALVTSNGIISPAAKFLKEQRTWRGLGSDFEIKYEENEEEQGALVEEGRTGVAGGYAVGEGEKT
jgi:diphthamide biosynthesis protein 2